jgi:hypothetical protein
MQKFKGVNGAEIHCRPSLQYGDSIFLQWSIYKCTDMFKSGWKGVTDKEWSERLSTSTNEGSAELVHMLILISRRMTVYEATNQLQVSHGSAYEIIHFFTSVKFVHGGFQNNSQKCIGVTAFWISNMWGHHLLESHSHWWQCGSTTTSHRENIKVHNGNTKYKLNSVVLVRKRTILTEQLQPVGKVSTNFSW